MIALALPLLAATGLVPDREPGAPWVRFQVEGRSPMFVDPTSVREENGAKVIRMVKTAETAAMSEIYADLSVSCENRQGEIIRLIFSKTGRTAELAPADRARPDPNSDFMRSVISFVCDGKKLQ